MRTLTVEEASSSLAKWLELAIAGEGIRIHTGDAVVELRPVVDQQRQEQLSPREALRQLQSEARLTKGQAEEYLEEVGRERLAAELRRPA